MRVGNKKLYLKYLMIMFRRNKNKFILLYLLYEEFLVKYYLYKFILLINFFFFLIVFIKYY